MFLALLVIDSSFFLVGQKKEERLLNFVIFFPVVCICTSLENSYNSILFWLTLNYELSKKEEKKCFVYDYGFI